MTHNTAAIQTDISMDDVGLCVGISVLLWDSQESTVFRFADNLDGSIEQ